MNSLAPTATQVRRRIRAPGSAIYRALLDANAVATWLAPEGMTGRVHEFEPHEAGTFRISLIGNHPVGDARTAPAYTLNGRFMKLDSNQRIIESMQFETDRPALQGETIVTFDLNESAAGTEVVVTHDNLPPGLSAADNELSWNISLARLAEVVEGGKRHVRSPNGI